MAISTAAKATSHGHRRKIGRRSTRRRAMGIRSAAAIAVRAKTSVAGEISATATRMRK